MEEIEGQQKGLANGTTGADAPMGVPAPGAAASAVHLKRRELSGAFRL